jgi:hypothetical protein
MRYQLLDLQRLVSSLLDLVSSLLFWLIHGPDCTSYDNNSEEVGCNWPESQSSKRRLSALPKTFIGFKSQRKIQPNLRYLIENPDDRPPWGF